MVNSIIFCSIFIGFCFICYNVAIRLKKKPIEKLLNSDKVMDKIINSFK